MPWNNKPPSGGEDLEGQDESQAVRHEKFLPYQAQ
jgi:hypothetical protein